MGVGPFNLSVAALLHPLEVRARFFERSPEFHWHAGLLFDESTLQVSFLKDLVTLADPTSPFSFLSFLFATRRLYRFINADLPRVSRREFNQYFRWACDRLPSVEMGKTVESVSFEGDTFLLDVGGERVRARNLVLGTGLGPAVPACARPHLGATVFHASSFLRQGLDPRGKRIVVVGGGQTGAELVHQLLLDPQRLPAGIHWITRRSNYLPLDESAFTNELFTPAYSAHFFSLPPEEKERLLSEQKLASNGVSSGLLQQIYRRLYELEFLSGPGRICALHVERELVDVAPDHGAWRVEFRHLHGGGGETLLADVVILCTGWEYRRPEFLGPLADRIPFDARGFTVRRDFSVEWDGPEENRIYVQNAARHTHGVAEPNLSLMAWRAATIVNSLAGRNVYDIGHASAAFDWGQAWVPHFQETV